MTLQKLINILLQWISINTNYDTSKFDLPVNIVEPQKIQEKKRRNRLGRHDQRTVGRRPAHHVHSEARSWLPRQRYFHSTQDRGLAKQNR